MEIVPQTDIGTDIRHNKKQLSARQSSHHHYHHPHHHHHQFHNQQQNSQQTSKTPAASSTPTSPHQQSRGSSGLGGSGGGVSFDSQAQSSSMAYQHKHALHRLRRLKKRSPHRDLVISFVPRLRISIINRLDFFHRYSKQEQEVLSCFDFLDELVLNYCDGGLDSPRYSQKLNETMIYELM